MGPGPKTSPSHRAPVRHGHGRVASPSHRAVRPRYGRIVSAVSALSVTSVAVLGALGVIPVGGEVARTAAMGNGAGAASAMQLSGFSGEGRPAEPVSDAGPTMPDPEPMLPPTSPGPAETDALPADSGSGKRVVFDISAQRVWLVDADDRVHRTYLVSGSVTDNLEPGSYEVYSTSRHAVGIDESGTMQYMVRFAHGKRAAIGFHDIPVDKGRPLQTRLALGTPQSHGCIRQARPDARALWDFAGVGTTVVVTA